MAYPYSKIEGGIILSIILFFWGIGAYFLGSFTLAKTLTGSGGVLFIVLFYRRFIQK